MENLNSVCFVGKIQEINEIQGADKIEQAIISGWGCVIQKGEFTEGNLVVLAVTDAVIPFELAEKLNITKYLKYRKKTNQYTVKTTKLRSVYSTATIVGTAYDFVKIPSEGKDMMAYYNISKYEEPAVILNIPGGKKIRYQKNPNFHVYYKFPNSKNVPEMFTEGEDVVITRKIHGCNARYGIVKKSKLTFLDGIKKKLSKFFPKWQYIDYEYVYGSHEVEKGSDSQGFYSTDVWAEVAKKYQIKEKLWSYFKDGGVDNIILYGEIYGPGIQKYYDYGAKEHEIQFFDIKEGEEYISDYSFKRTITQIGLPFIKSLEAKYNKEYITSLYINTFVDEKKKVPEEGVVIKCPSGDRKKIAKFINPAYLEFQSKKEDSTDFH